MTDELKKLVEVSRHYGKNKDYVIAGGGNTSFKTDEFLWVKASGTTLADIGEDGFVKLYRDKLELISQKEYSTVPAEREDQVKKDLYASIADPEKKLRPSVETSFHNTISYKYIVHTHPNLVNGLLCGNNSREIYKEIFDDTAIYIEYTDPGYILFKKVETEIEKYKAAKGNEPKIILLENHGIFVSADTTEEIKAIYADIEEKLNSRISGKPRVEVLPTDEKARTIVPAIKAILSADGTKIAKIRNNRLINYFSVDKDSYQKVCLPFSPDIIVYCKSKFIYLESEGTAEEIIAEFKEKLEDFKTNNTFLPKVILIKNIGLVGVDINAKSAETVLDIYEDLMKISFYSDAFGGPRFMTQGQIDFIDNWEVENYRRKLAQGQSLASVVEQKIIIITGAAQGFGEGIARELFNRNANIVIADINEEKGFELQDQLNGKKGNNRALFVKTDVSSAESVKNLIFETVKTFGGLDVFISNAGVLRAGGLDEMEPDVFDFMTKINYTGYFICSKFASEVMKTQAKYGTGNYSDIIQVNSKSGLKGSNKNFAYAGGKFGGIGLTQSFALELMPFRIKVNSICPGNFFDGPLWSDPEKGLFVQYLNAGKVPGAKTIADVKQFYEAQVPAKRGCYVEDVVKAILYAIDQKYETGQAIPVTGGQNMLK